ncbi:hypothetical protein, partial [Zoogloea sp.]|uniref:hypothetical protein n=1 Tax=Zoogloea sp. TaxID=49181 RepID=UPI0031FC11FD
AAAPLPAGLRLKPVVARAATEAPASGGLPALLLLAFLSGLVRQWRLCRTPLVSLSVEPFPVRGV